MLPKSNNCLLPQVFMMTPDLINIYFLTEICLQARSYKSDVDSHYDVKNINMIDRCGYKTKCFL